MNTAYVIPFRQRGNDPLRTANLNRVLEYWDTHGIKAQVFDDGRSGAESFNRSAAYNKAIRELDADMFVFTEADLLVPIPQIDLGIALAQMKPGLCIPFSHFMAMSPEDSERVRRYEITPPEASAEEMCGYRQSIGAVNIVSRASVEMIGGYDSSFEGSYYDDSAMRIAFDICCGPTRFSDGSGFHLWHLPGYTGPHLTDEDRAATERNKERFELYRVAQTPERIRHLTAGGR